MDQQKKERIFISYKRVDKERVYSIKDGIEKVAGKGCCAVVGTSGNYEVIDEFVGPVDDNKTVLQTVYMDGRSMNEVTFQQVRENLHGKRD